MFKKIRRRFLILCLALIVLPAGCAQAEVSGEVVLGVAWPFATGNDLFNEGIDLAVRDINESGGINGRELRLLKADDGSEVEKGVAIAENFAGNQAVLAVIGHSNSFVSVPAAAIYEQAGLVMLSPGSTAPELTQKGYRYIFRNLPNDDQIGMKMASYLAGQGHRRMVIYYSNDAYGTGLANSFEDHAKELGITIVDRVDYYSGVEDLKRLDDRWRAFGFDGIFIASSMPEGAQFIADLRQAGIKEALAGGDALNTPQLITIAGQAAEGIAIISMMNPNSDRPEVKQFISAFQAAYGEIPNSNAALGYDAVQIMAAALKKAKGQSRADVAVSLRNLGRWPGVSGVHELSATGDDLGDLAIVKQLRNGEYVYLVK